MPGFIAGILKIDKAHVVNRDIDHQLPEQIEYFTHRSDCTARAGKKGGSLALIEPRERPKITKLENDFELTFSELHLHRLPLEDLSDP